MAKKGQKEKDDANRSSGGLFMSLVLAAFSIGLGFFLGVANLAIIPVETVSKLPEAEDRKAHTVYYVQARDSGGSGYQAKEEALLGDGKVTISLSAAELNKWSSDTFRFTKPDDDSGRVILIPSAPKFTITDGTINMSVTLELQYGESSKKMLFQTQGTFQQLNGKPVFIAEESYLGSARLPPEVVAPFIRDSMLSMFKSAEQAEEYFNAWNNLSNVSVTGNFLTLAKG